MPPESFPAGRPRNGSIRVMRRSCASDLRAPRPRCRTGRHRTTMFSSTVRSTVKPEPLGHVPDLVLYRVELLRDVLAGHDDLALRRVEQPADQAQRGGLAGAVGTHQPEDLAGRTSRISSSTAVSAPKRRVRLRSEMISWSAIGFELDLGVRGHVRLQLVIADSPPGS